MRKTMFVLGGLVCATWLSAQDYQKTAYGIKAAAGGVDVEVQFFTPSVVRVVKSPQGEHFEKKSLAVVASPGEVGVKVGIKDGAIVMDTKVLQVNLDTSPVHFPTGRLMASFCLPRSRWRSRSFPLTTQAMPPTTCIRLSSSMRTRPFTGWDSCKTGKCRKGACGRT